MESFKLVEGQTSRLEFMFSCGKLSIILDFNNVSDDDIYYWSCAGKNSPRGPQYSDPPDGECYMETYENIEVCFQAEGQEIEKESFAKRLGISVEDLDKLVKKLEEEAEPLYLSGWEPICDYNEDH